MLCINCAIFCQLNGTFFPSSFIETEQDSVYFLGLEHFDFFPIFTIILQSLALCPAHTYIRTYVCM